MANNEISLEAAIQKGSKIFLATLILIAKSRRVDERTRIVAIEEILKRAGLPPMPK